MGSVYLKRRETRTKGTRWHVRYERDRASPVVFLGSFATEKEAKARKLAAQVELSQGREPSRFATPVAVSTTVKRVAERWLASRIDVSERTFTNYEISVQDILQAFGSRDPSSLGRDDIQDWVGKMSGGVVRLRISTLAQILDHAGVVPNPARGTQIRKPRRARKSKFLPTAKQLAAVYAEIAKYDTEKVYACRLLEHLGLRVNELIEMPRRNVDRKRGRVFVEWAKTTAGVRFVDVLDGSVELPPKGEGRCFSFTDQALRNALIRACEDAGVPRITPHTLRHLSASRLLHSGRLSPVELQHRLGHEKLSTTLNEYAHLVPPEDE